MLKKMATGADYFADAGGVARVAAAVALTPFALLFTLCSLVTPVAAVCIAFGGDWRLAGIVLGSGLFYTLLAFPLCRLTVRLFRGRKSANGVTVLPTWLVRAFLVFFFGPLSVGMAACMFIWAYRAGVDRDWSLAVLWAVGACGFLAGLARAIPTAFRLTDRKTGDDAGPSALVG